MNRSKKSLYNMVFGIGNQLIVLIVGLIVPKLFIVSYGSEVNGLQSSISYIYTYIALLESGIGIATVQALLRALGRNSKEEANSVLAATNSQYKRVAYMYGAAVIVLSIVFPFTVSTTVNPITVGFMVLLSGVGSFISFLTYGKFVLLLTADGRSFVVSIITLVDYILKNAIKITLIMCGIHFIWVYTITAVVSLVNLTFYHFYKKKHYPWLNYKVKPNKAAISQSKNVLVHQISNILCNSTDVLVLTYIVRDLRLVSVYNVYLMVFDAIKSLTINVFSSVNFIMGQTYNSDIQKYRKLHNIYEVADFTVSFILYSTACVMMTPFLSLYTAGITDISYIDRYLPVLFAVVKLMTSVREPASQLINYAQHFKKTQWRSIVETVINVVVSIVACFMLGYWGISGIYGVLIGTVVALGYRTIDMYLYTSRRFLDRSVWVSVKHWIVYMGAFFIMLLVFEQFVITVNGYIDFFLKAFLVLVIEVAYYCVCTTVFNFKTVKAIANILKNRIKLRRGV